MSMPNVAVLSTLNLGGRVKKALITVISTLRKANGLVFVEGFASSFTECPCLKKIDSPSRYCIIIINTCRTSSGACGRGARVCVGSK